MSATAQGPPGIWSCSTVESHADDRERRASIPSGTVTFLFTDIEGSTKLLERLREHFAAELAEQNEISRTAA